ncbi:methylenetetrahydrofolate reductase [Saxibacter everestensis]|uniref:Methylenetetrahydrofolate reductase n=1 Tax=Saxibacter everestensis TaxID=2909229 RepID=A0ABY8QXJ6_9MICO|nr:methylenetetrahydrofolate reductase [Brevibacteriaceae bacterium ZFBP1038]
MLIHAPAPTTNPVALSYELHPPRSAEAAANLATTISHLEDTSPDYVAVTYGANGSNQDSAFELLSRLLRETTIRPLAHLTCVGTPTGRLRGIVDELLDVGVRGILALRGDIPADASWPPDDGLRYATELVQLIRDVENQRTARLAGGRVSVGVAAYPTKHPESPTHSHDVEVLLAKQQAGADFAITQVFFHPGQYVDLVAEARRAGVTIPIIPGVMPLTNARRIGKLSELAGVNPPTGLQARLDAATSQSERLRIGVAATVDLIRATLEAGAPGLHLYTFNHHVSALAVLDDLELPRPSRRAEPALA